MTGPDGFRLVAWAAATSASTWGRRPVSARPSPCSTKGGAAMSGGTEVVVAVVETHGRAHTAEQLEGLEVIPRRTVAYRGTTLDEMDLDAVLERAPDVALVDELAHTNAPGGRQREAVAGHRGAARCRHRCDLDGQHPAPRGSQRRGRGHHGHPPGRDRARRLGARRRPDRARRHDARSDPSPHGPRQHLSGRAHRRGARQLLPRGQPVRAARARSALAGRPGRRGADRVPGPSRHRATVGDARAGGRRAHRRARRRPPGPTGGADGDAHPVRPRRCARAGRRRGEERTRGAARHAPERCWLSSAAGTSRSPARTWPRRCSTRLDQRGPPSSSSVPPAGRAWPS